jgi:NADH-quinone oxidoreductase subunit M
LKAIRDLRPHEVAAFAPLLVLVLLMGIYPDLFLEPMAASVDQLIAEAVAGSDADLAAR